MELVDWQEVRTGTGERVGGTIIKPTYLDAAPRLSDLIPPRHTVRMHNMGYVRYFTVRSRRKLKNGNVRLYVENWIEGPTGRE